MHTKFTVIGAARSGLAAARLLQSKGASVFLSENSSKEKMTDAASLLAEMQIAHEFGGHSKHVFDADIFVLSPGVPSDAVIVREAESRGIEIISEIELASWFCSAPIIAITGTNGKTTTTALTGKIFSDAGWKTIVAGNIGQAFSDYVAVPQNDGAVVLEVSSYQLDHIHLFHPNMSIITTITPDHLDRYNFSYAEYINSKKRIFMNQTSNDVLIYNSDYNDIVDAITDAKHLRTFPLSVKKFLTTGGWMKDDNLFINIGGGKECISNTSDFMMRGSHNYANMLAAALASRVMGISLEQIRQTCRTFAGVEHRLEFVRELHDVKYINDSKATNVDSVVVALQSFNEPVILIAGGRDKHAPYDPLFPLVSSLVKEMILIGEAADRMESEFNDKTKIARASSMEEAVNIAHASAKSGDIVLLSPACASFDMFNNFEHRGEIFKQIVAQLKNNS